MAKTIDIIAENPGDGGVFVARIDDGRVRIGFKGVAATDSKHVAFMAFAVRAPALSGNDLEDAACQALKALYDDRKAKITA